jgi:hypothetical protein
MKLVQIIPLEGLSGAVKVCVQYERGLSKKLRCKQWAAGPGYAQGPHEYDNYYIDTVRQEAGVRRAYRYRKSLPYNPRAGGTRFPNTPANIKLSERTQSKFDTLPEPVQVTILSRYGKISPRFTDESLPPKDKPAALPPPPAPDKKGRKPRKKS